MPLNEPDDRRDSILHTGILGDGNLRAAILGVNDGLVSNFSLVMGVAGGADDPKWVLLAGIAGLLAGAFSMAAGEYVSVGGQRDVYRNRIETLASSLRTSQHEEILRIAAIYETKGLTTLESMNVAKRLMENPDTALDTVVREELGLSPETLGSPLGAASSSFVAFVLGAIIPILPYLLGAGSLAFMLSAGLSAIALVVVGALVSAVSGRNIVWGGAKMLMAGGFAAAITFGIGSLVGIAVTG
ncbi:MAG: VIT1/CCC1 transporter family protein [Dehalococcoidia bacterium]|nr:VIT1/CCC1 transporter family protein [Dehalococcoidia bacterium]